MGSTKNETVFRRFFPFFHLPASPPPPPFSYARFLQLTTAAIFSRSTFPPSQITSHVRADQATATLPSSSYNTLNKNTLGAQPRKVHLYYNWQRQLALFLCCEGRWDTHEGVVDPATSESSSVRSLLSRPTSTHIPPYSRAFLSSPLSFDLAPE